MTVLAGDDAVFMLVPEEGNKVKTVTVNGASGTTAFTLENNTLTIPDVQEDLALNVVFEEVQTPADPVDKTQLNQAITDAEYILAHKDSYQKETLEGLEEALRYAETVAEKTEAVQEEVDQAAQRLEKEIQEVRPAEDTGAQGGGNNGDENTDPVNPSQNKTEQAAKTGNERNPFIPGAGAVLSLAVLIMAAVRKRYR